MVKAKVEDIAIKIDRIEEKVNDNHAFLQAVEKYTKKTILVLVIVLLSFKFDMSSIKEILEIIK